MSLDTGSSNDVELVDRLTVVAKRKLKFEQNGGPVAEGTVCTFRKV
jgi:hypothetical protein